MNRFVGTRCFVVLGVCWSLSAGTVAVFPVNGTNLGEGEAEAIGALMARSYKRVCDCTVLDAATVAAAYGDAGKDSEAAAAALKVDEYLMVEAVALRSKVLLSAERRGRGGERIFDAEMTAASLDDIEPVCDRLARALVEKLPTQETITLDNVTETETKRRNRVFADKITGVKTGVIVPMSRAVTLQPIALIGYHMKVESDLFCLEFGAVAALPANMSDDHRSYGGAIFDMGYNRYLNESPVVAPYWGGGVSPRVLLSSEFTVGVAPYAQIGVMFMRFSRTRIFAQLRVAQNALPVTVRTDREYDAGIYSWSYQTTQCYPTEISLEFGIGW